MRIQLFFLAAIVLCSCSQAGGDNSEEQIAGSWTLVKMEGINDNSAIEVKECDANTQWNFTTENAEPLGDGTETMKIVARAPEGCKWFGFDSKWATVDGKLFIASTRVGGMGGNSNAGLFTINELTENKMVLEILSNRYFFER